MKLDRFQRLLLANQFKILESLYPDDAPYYSQHRKALEEGYELHYEWAFEHIYKDDESLTEEQCRFVIDVLNMYRSLNTARRSYDDKLGVDPQRLAFRGFDGNNEGPMLGYARYFIEDLGRFDELKNQYPHNDFNSHMPMESVYARMLHTWKSIKDPWNLTPDDVQRILNS